MGNNVLTYTQGEKIMFNRTTIPSASAVGRPRDPATQAYLDAVADLQQTGGALSTVIEGCTLDTEPTKNGDGKSERYTDKRLRCALAAMTTASKEYNVTVRKQLTTENGGVKITFWVIEKIKRVRGKNSKTEETETEETETEQSNTVKTVKPSVMAKKP